MSVEAPTAFHVGDESIDDFTDVLDIKTGAVVRRIGGGGTEELGDGLNAALFGFRMPFHNKGGRSHP